MTSNLAGATASSGGLMAKPVGAAAELADAIRLHCAPERYRENSANIPRQLRELPFSVLAGFVRLSQHTQECKTQSQLSWRTCASLREALPSHRPGLISLVRLARVEKPLRACSYSLTTPPDRCYGIIGLSLSATGQTHGISLLRCDNTARPVHMPFS